MVQGGPTLIVNAPARGSAVQRQPLHPDPGRSRAPTPRPRRWRECQRDADRSPTTSSKYDVYTATVWFGPPPTPSGAQTFPQLTGRQLLDVKESDGTATSEVLRTFIIDTAGPTITKTTPTARRDGRRRGDDLRHHHRRIRRARFVGGGRHRRPAGKPSVHAAAASPRGAASTAPCSTPLNLTRCGPPPATSLCIVFPTISFRASDSVGNETSVGYDFSVDNIPPLADLDPPQMRQMRLAVGRIRVLVPLRSAQRQPLRGRHAQRRLHGAAGVRPAGAHRGPGQPSQSGSRCARSPASIPTTPASTS